MAVKRIRLLNSPSSSVDSDQKHQIGLGYPALTPSASTVFVRKCSSPLGTKLGTKQLQGN